MEHANLSVNSEVASGHVTQPGNAVALLHAIKLIIRLIFSISLCVSLHQPGERQLQMAICIKSSPVTPDYSDHIFSQLMNCSRL